MRKSLLKLMTLLVLATSLQGCYGKFALTRKVYAMNGEVADKYMRSGLTWVLVIVPVYAVAGLADFVVLNTMEFWSGKNPVAEGEKDFRYVDGADRYDIHAVKKGDEVIYSIAHYSFDTYVDSLQVNWDRNSDTARSRFDDGTAVTENFVSRDSSGIRMQLRPAGSLPQTVALASVN